MFKCGEKFTINNCSIDVEIIGFYPKSQNKDGKDYYVATLNGEKMKVASSFIEMLQKAQKKEEIIDKIVDEVTEKSKDEVVKEEINKKESKRNGRRK